MNLDGDNSLHSCLFNDIRKNPTGKKDTPIEVDFRLMRGCAVATENKKENLYIVGCENYRTREFPINHDWDDSPSVQESPPPSGTFCT